MSSSIFTKLKDVSSDLSLPSKFTFPFSHTPHKLCVQASEQLQDYLDTQKDFEYDFGIKANSDATGKMFGILIVKNEKNELGYISAFSGKLANQYVLPRFAPPIFDIQKEGVFYTNGMLEIEALEKKIDRIENSSKYKQLVETIVTERKNTKQGIATARKEQELEKAERKDNLRFERMTISSSDYDQLCVAYSEENTLKEEQFEQLAEELRERIYTLEDELNPMEYELGNIETQRDQLSNRIHKQLYAQFNFLNTASEEKNLLEVFEAAKSKTPPSGSGECAIPKLLQYAFLNNLEPIAMTQFWWGAPPASTIRKHKEYYPACMGKCEPILMHMLAGMEIDENPYHKNRGADQKIEIIYEDAAMLVLNKPVDVLSVPGRVVKDSVLSRMEEKYPQASGPMIVHRLDQSTSGVMLVAKTKKAHKRLQKQFIEHTIKKQYIAILDGEIPNDKTEGLIDLPICLDYNNRPRQQVNFEEGKPAQTKWEVKEVSNGKTRIIFTPITGRTHQLRVHAAHKDGLNLSILGDDLYGSRGGRLHLHAMSIAFVHPNSKKEMKFTVDTPF